MRLRLLRMMEKILLNRPLFFPLLIIILSLIFICLYQLLDFYDYSLHMNGLAATALPKTLNERSQASHQIDVSRFSSSFSISPPSCASSQPPFLVLFIFVRPTGFIRRQTIRETYGSLATSSANCTKSIKLLFIIGQEPNSTVQRQITEEAGKFSDIVQTTDFIDSYGQATRKGLAILKWTLAYCPSAQFIAKADDDCWVNLPALMDSLEKSRNEEKVFGLLWAGGAPVIRDPRNKWYVSVDDYPAPRFPPYVSGILYAFHQQVIGKIYQATEGMKYLWHDDVFLTGIAPKRAGVGHVDLSSFGYNYDLVGRQWKTECAKKRLMAIHYVEEPKMRSLWEDKCWEYKLDC